MTNSILTRLVVVSLLLVLCPVKSPAKEYVLTVGSEQFRFVPQGEKGYVVKQPKRTAGISTLAGTLFLEEGQVRPIGGLDRHGIWIVENDGPASRNDAVMAELIQDGAAEYVAPLFSSNGETVAVIPEIVIRVHPGVDARQVHFLCQSLALAIIKPMEFTTQEYLLQSLGLMQMPYSLRSKSSMPFHSLNGRPRIPRASQGWPDSLLLSARMFERNFVPRMPGKAPACLAYFPTMSISPCSGTCTIQASPSQANLSVRRVRTFAPRKPGRSRPEILTL
jgi:hypothetical protein